MGGKRAWVLAALLASGAGWMTPTDGAAQGRYQPEGPARRAFESAEALRQQGDALRRKGDADGANTAYRSALAGFVEAVEADADYIDAYARLGELAYRLRTPKAAVARLEAGLRRAPKHPDLMFWQGQNLVLAGQRRAGVRLLERVAADHPDAWPEVFLALGTHYFEQRDFRSAEPAFEQFVKRNPDALAVRGKLGNTYFQLKKFREALAEFEAVRAQRPDDVRVLTNIGNTLFQLKDYARAIEVLERAIALEPDRDTTLFNLAYSYFKLERHADALTYLERYNRVAPGKFNGQYFAGVSAMKLGRDEAALAYLAQAGQIMPNTPNPPYNMGLIHLKAGRLDQAEPLLKKAFDLKRDNPWLISAMGSLARARGEFDTALALHRRAVSLAPEAGRLHGNLALSALRAGDVPAAMAAFEKALALAKDDAWVRRLGGSVLAAHARQRAAAGAPVEAVAALDRALSLRPAEPTLLANRALLRLETGQVPLAVADAEAAHQTQVTPLTQLALGRARLAQGRAADAVAPLTAAATTKPEPATHAALGAAQLLAGQIEPAVETLDAAVKRWPKHPALTLDRALAHLARVAPRVARSRGTGRDAADLRLALAQVKRLPAGLAAQVRYAAAVFALRQGDGGEGRAQLGAMAKALRAAGDAKVVKQAPRQHFELLRALAAFQTRRYGAAEAVLAKMPAAKKGSTRAGQLARATQERLGRAAYAQGDARGAVRHFKAANTIARQPATTHNLAVLQFNPARPGGAERVFKAVQSAVPEALFNLAVIAEARGDHAAAWRDYTRYGKTSRPHAAKAREIAEAKQRVFGFKEGAQ